MKESCRPDDPNPVGDQERCAFDELAKLTVFLDRKGLLRIHRDHVPRFAAAGHLGVDEGQRALHVDRVDRGTGNADSADLLHGLFRRCDLT